MKINTNNSRDESKTKLIAFTTIFMWENPVYHLTMMNKELLRFLAKVKEASLLLHGSAFKNIVWPCKFFGF